MGYCRVSKNSRVHIFESKQVRYNGFASKGYVFPVCGLTDGPLIEATKEEFDENGCKGCKKQLLRLAITKMKYGERLFARWDDKYK
jgi:hypothetical protein